MASVWKHPKSKFWYARFTNSAGIQQNRSTKTTDRRKAERLANQYEDAYRHKLTEVQIRRVLSEINEKLNGQALPSMSVKEYLDDWVGSVVAETSPTTAEKYRGTARDFIVWLGDRAQDDLARITTVDLTRWRDAQMKANAPQTVRGKLKILKVAFKRAWRMGVLLDDPAISRAPMTPSSWTSLVTTRRRSVGTTRTPPRRVRSRPWPSCRTSQSPSGRLHVAR